MTYKDKASYDSMPPSIIYDIADFYVTRLIHVSQDS